MADRVEDRPSLKDLDGVRVAVEEPVAPPLDRDVLRMAVERQVRTANIRVLGMGEFPTGDPHLRVTVSLSQALSGIVACAVQLDFVQIVFMRRNPAVTFNRAQTWKADAQLLLVPPTNVADAVTRELARQVDQFVSDYRAVNGG
jgi:hypothetical protein